MRTSLSTIQQALRGAAHEAANFYEPHCKRSLTRQPESFATVLDRVPSNYQGLIRGVAKTCAPFDGSLESMFTPDALKLLCDSSASAFFFWRLVAFSAELTRSMPMQTEDVERGKKELARRMLIGTALGQQLLNAPMPSVRRLSSDQRQAMFREGFIIPQHGASFNAADASTMELNPIFL